MITTQMYRVRVLFMSGKEEYFTFSSHDSARANYHLLTQIMGTEKLAAITSKYRVSTIRGTGIDLIEME